MASSRRVPLTYAHVHSILYSKTRGEGKILLHKSLQMPCGRNDSEISQTLLMQQLCRDAFELAWGFDVDVEGMFSEKPNEQEPVSSVPTDWNILPPAASAVLHTTPEPPASTEGTDLELSLPELIVVQQALQLIASRIWGAQHITGPHQEVYHTAHKLLKDLNPIRFELEERMAEMEAGR